MNFVNRSFGHFSAQMIAIRRDDNWLSFADKIILLKNVGVDAMNVDFVCDIALVIFIESLGSGE